MLLMGIATCAGTSVADFARKAVEILTTDPYPDWIKRDYYITLGGDGFKQYYIWNIEKGREDEGLKDIGSRITRVITSIEGMKYTLEPLYTAEEAFAMIGMAAPSPQALGRPETD